MEGEGQSVQPAPSPGARIQKEPGRRWVTPGPFWSLGTVCRCQGCRGRPGPKEGGRAEFRSRSWCGSWAGAGRGGGETEPPNQRGAQGGTSAGAEGGPGADLVGVDCVVSARGSAGPARICPPPQVPGAGGRAAWPGRAARKAGAGAGAAAGPGPCALARPPGRATVAGRVRSGAAAGPGAGRGRRGPAQEVPPASASCPPRPGPRRRRRSRPPRARWA